MKRYKLVSEEDIKSISRIIREIKFYIRVNDDYSVIEYVNILLRQLEIIGLISRRE